MEKIVNVIGAGLAGVEASYQLAKRGYKVRLYEMRPKKMTPAHHSENFAVYSTLIISLKYCVKRSLVKIPVSVGLNALSTNST